MDISMDIHIHGKPAIVRELKRESCIGYAYRQIDWVLARTRPTTYHTRAER